jgi:hypothetical protein
MITVQTDLKKALNDAVDLVNEHSGAASVRLEYDGAPPIDFVANSGSFEGENFVFTAGFETYGGTFAHS